MDPFGNVFEAFGKDFVLLLLSTAVGASDGVLSSNFWAGRPKSFACVELRDAPSLPTSREIYSALLLLWGVCGKNFY